VHDDLIAETLDAVHRHHLGREASHLAR
jgi:hypothetical protein